MAKKLRKLILSSTVAIERLDEILRTVRSDVRTAIEVEAVLESANDFIGGRTITTEHGEAYEAIHLSMVVNLAMALSRLFDIGRRYPIVSQDKASLPVMLHILRQRPCREAIEEKAAAWTAGMSKQGRSDAIRSMDSAISTYTDLLAKSEGRQSLRRLKELRNKRLAHPLLQELQQAPYYRDLFELLKGACLIFQHAQLAVLGRNWDFDEARTLARGRADAFWSPALSAVWGVPRSHDIV